MKWAQFILNFSKANYLLWMMTTLFVYCGYALHSRNFYPHYKTNFGFQLFFVYLLGSKDYYSFKKGRRRTFLVSGKRNVINFTRCCSEWVLHHNLCFSWNVKYKIINIFFQRFHVKFRNWRKKSILYVYIFYIARNFNY